MIPSSSAAITARDRELARSLIRYSTAAKPGELVFIQCVGADTLGLGAACAEEAVAAGAAPYLHLTEPWISRNFISKAPAHVMERLAQFELKQMQDATCFIGIRGGANSYETSDVPADQRSLYNKLIVHPVHMEERVKRTRWVVLRYPSPSMAQLAQQSTEAFADFYYRVCLVDYAYMAEAVKPLKALMERTRHVHLKGPGTDLQFEVTGVPAIPCCGTMNVPDGECFTAPLRESMHGTVAFNSPTIWEGNPYENIRLRFEAGKCVHAEAANAAQTERLNQVLDQDEGARYVGEWSLGFHPEILEPMRDILFDEKIAGSFHMALGQCYDEAPNGNQSALHWDMVCIQRPEHGGGEVWFDGVLIRKDGLFVLEELDGLNPASYKRG